MLLKQSTLAGIAWGRITVAFRRWRRPRVRAGSTVRTSVGVIGIETVAPTSLNAITEREARSAGYPSWSALATDLARYGEGRLYRISLRLVGADPRLALRRQTRLTDDDLNAISKRLARFDAAGGPSARQILQVIAAQPGVRAADLAIQLRMETLPFKVRVRRLKDLGLTESLEVGYRLSPRGRALLPRLERSMT
jgi:hypothetical protein